MSENLFDYENRRFREEVLYLLRQLAEYQGIIPFDEKDRRCHVDPDWDGWVSEDPHAALEAVLRDSGEKFEAPAPAVSKLARRRRFNFSKFDEVIADAESLRTGWRARGKAAKTAEHRAYCETQEIYWKNLAARRRKRIEFEIKKGRAEIVDGVLYDLRSGVRAPWDASLFVTK
jgi:hypothetical protein